MNVECAVAILSLDNNFENSGALSGAKVVYNVLPHAELEKTAPQCHLQAAPGVETAGRGPFLSEGMSFGSF